MRRRALSKPIIIASTYRQKKSDICVRQVAAAGTIANKLSATFKKLNFFCSQCCNSHLYLTKNRGQYLILYFTLSYYMSDGIIKLKKKETKN